MKKNDFVLPILIILLLFFVPASIYGVHKHNSSILDRDNPKHLYKNNNKLYFYSADDVLLGIYECKQKNLCDRVTTTVDDADNEYKSIDPVMLPIYNDEFAFIQDGEQISYYWVKNDKIIYNLNVVKDYGIGIQGNLLIVQDETFKYGLFDPFTGSYVINPTYDYMGLTGNDLVDDKISIDKIIVNKDGYYYLIDETENELTAKIADAIYTYDKDFIYAKTNLGNYIVVDYQGNTIIDDDFKVVNLLENCNALISTSFMIKIYSKDFNYIYYDEPCDSENISFSEEDGKVIVTDVDGNTIATVPIDEDHAVPVEDTTEYNY